jgi:hypothetical protein
VFIEKVNSLVCIKVQRKLGVKALNNNSRRSLDGLCADSSLKKREKEKEKGRKSKIILAKKIIGSPNFFFQNK